VFYTLTKCLLTCGNVTHWSKDQQFVQSSWPIASLQSLHDLSTRANESASSEILSLLTYPCSLLILFIQLSALLLRTPINNIETLPEYLGRGPRHVLIWLNRESQFILKISHVDNCQYNTPALLCRDGHMAHGECVLRCSQFEFLLRKKR